MANDLKPTVSAIEALRDVRRPLRWSAIGFHLDRPCFCVGAVGLAYGVGSALIFAPMIRPP
jgi:hypothetical protein